MDLRKLKTLIDLVSESNVSELEITEAEGKVRIVKGGGAGPYMMAPAPVAVAHPLPAAAPAAQAAEPVAAAPAEPTGHIVKSPMVGTFYSVPGEGAPPFVQEGDPVAAGQTLCILEAMKLFNELKSDHAGVVKRIAVRNADPVEYGQLLFELV